MPYQFLQLLPDFKKNKKLPQMLGEYFKLFKVFQSFAHTRKPRLIHTFWIRNKEHQTPTHNQMIRRKLYVSGWDKNSVCLWKIKCFDISPENKQTDQAFLIFICLWATIIRSFFNSLICESVFSALGRDIQKRTFASCSGSDRLRHCHMIWPISCSCNFLRYKKNTRESLEYMYVIITKSQLLSEICGLKGNTMQNYVFEYLVQVPRKRTHKFMSYKWVYLVYNYCWFIFL